MAEAAACILIAAANADAHTSPLAAGIDCQTPGVRTAGNATRGSDELPSSQHNHPQTDVRANGHEPKSLPTACRAVGAAPAPSAAAAARLQSDLPQDSQPTPTVAAASLPPAPETPPATQPTPAAASDAASAVGTNTQIADNRSDYEVSAINDELMHDASHNVKRWRRIAIMGIDDSDADRVQNN